MCSRNRQRQFTNKFREDTRIMDIERPNWLYCLSNEQHEVTTALMPGLMHMSDSAENYACMYHFYIEREYVEEYEVQQCLLFILWMLDEDYHYMDIFYNVSDSDVMVARLRYGFKRMYLIDTKEKEVAVKELARKVHATICYPTEDCLHEIEQRKQDRMNELSNICEVM